MSPEHIELLTQPRFTSTVGTKLAWASPRTLTFPPLVRGPAWRILHHFDTIATCPGLDSDEFAAFEGARQVLGDIADEIGERDAHPIREGEALVIPNDHYLHGREVMRADSDRLIFRGYALAKGIREPWESTIVRLDDA